MNYIDVPEPGDEIEMPRIDGPGWRTHRVTTIFNKYFIRAVDTSGMPTRFHCEHASWRYPTTQTKKRKAPLPPRETREATYQEVLQEKLRDLEMWKARTRRDLDLDDGP